MDTDSQSISCAANGALSVASYSAALSPTQLPSPFSISACIAFSATSDSLNGTMMLTTLDRSLSQYSIANMVSRHAPAVKHHSALLSRANAPEAICVERHINLTKCRGTLKVAQAKGAQNCGRFTESPLHCLFFGRQAVNSRRPRCLCGENDLERLLWHHSAASANHLYRRSKFWYTVVEYAFYDVLMPGAKIEP